MPFFEERPPRPTRKPRRRLRRDDYGRPTLFIPRYLDEDAVLAASDELAIVLHGIACYPTGVAFNLDTTTRYQVSDEDDPGVDRAFGLHGSRRGSDGRFGVEYSDGRRATLDEAWHSRDEPDSIVLEPGSGGGGGGHWSQEIWLAPLPPPGPVTFAVEWQSEGIPETLWTIDGEVIRGAAEHARPVFPA